MRPLKALSVAVAGLALFNLQLAHAHGDGQEEVKVLQEQALLNAPGKQGLLLTVDYAPGQRSVAHSHSGSVFAYVAEGEVISQLKGEEPKRFKAGESWYEPAGSVHLESRNASDSQPARLVVWILKTDKEAVLDPYPK